jgi:pimeloyl-ACP methyl ester carboxylesterase
MPVFRTIAPAKFSSLCISLFAVLTFLVLPATSLAQEASLPSIPPQVTLLDPVPSLLKGAAVTTNVNTLATKGRVVDGTAADSASELVLRIPANAAGEQFTIVVLNDQGAQSTSSTEDGGLGAIGTTTFTASQLTVAAVNTTTGPMAFAIYGSPLDFPRPEGQDTNDAERFVSLRVQALDTGLQSETPVTLLRPPLVLIHGLWANAASWDDFTPLINDTRWFISRADYSKIIGGQIKSYSPPVPSWARGSIANSPASALGFAYNAPTVLQQIYNFISNFKNGTNPANMPVAGVQADIVAHSMGGDITRTLPSITQFYHPITFSLGFVHKVITIGTPHWGSPLATMLLTSSNECVRGVLATNGSPSFTSVTFKNGTTATGGVADLRGDGFGGGLSAALQMLQNPIPHPLPTALIQGLESQSQLDGLNSSSAARAIRLLCFTDPLAKDLTSTGWPKIFGQESDSIVPALSAVAGLNTFTVVNGVIHSQSSEELGFGPPAELDAGGGIPETVIDLLNTPINNATYVPLPQQ